MNRIMRRWVKAGALIFVAMLVVAACEGPAGPTGKTGADGADGTDGTNGTDGTDGTDGTNGTDGEDGEDGVSMPQLFFGYAPFNELAAKEEPATMDNVIPGRFHDLPFPAGLANMVGNATATEELPSGTERGFQGVQGTGTPDVTSDDAPAMRSWAQCQVISEGNGIDLYSYMVTGGENPIHSVSVSQDMMTIESGMGGPGGVGNGFSIMADDMGVDWLSGHPNLKTGDYRFTLTASDAAAQPPMASVSWDFRVLPDSYVEPAGALDSLSEEPDADTTSNDTHEDSWGSFISSAYPPSSFGMTTQSDVSPTPGGAIPSLNLSRASKMLDGDMDTVTVASGEPADVDVIWVGGLTPNSVLELKIVGTTETGIGITNDVEVALYQHMPEEEIMPADRMAIMGGASDDFDAKYENLACGWYYFEVTGGADGATGGYTVTWDFDTSTE